MKYWKLCECEWNRLPLCVIQPAGQWMDGQIEHTVACTVRLQCFLFCFLFVMYLCTYLNQYCRVRVRLDAVLQSGKNTARINFVTDTMVVYLHVYHLWSHKQDISVMPEIMELLLLDFGSWRSQRSHKSHFWPCELNVSSRESLHI